MFEPRVETIEKVTWDGDGHVLFQTSGGVWCGSKRKDFWYPDDNWEKLLKTGVQIRIWTVSWSIILGFEALLNGKWRSVWCMANNFSSKADRKKSDLAYTNLIKKEGSKIAKLIDKGKSLEEINGLISKDHSGNTHACALSIGIQKARNRENADKVRKQHNKEWGVSDSGGLVNPAVLTLVTK